MLWAFVIRASLWLFFGAVIVIVSIALSIDIGLVDWLFGTGDKSRAILHDVLGFLNRHFNLNKANIELALKIIGLAATITFGALGLLRAFLLGYANIPMRLENYASRIRALHFDGRPVLLAPYAARNLRGDQTPPEPPRIWERILRLFGLDAHSRAVRRVLRTREGLDGDLRVLNAVLRLRKTERVTAHLVEGLRIAAEARRLPDGSTAQQDGNRAALVEFERATALDDTDLDALELAARQASTVNANTVVLRLERLEAQAQEQRRPTRRARALRLHAEFIADTDMRRAALRDVRTKLETALETLRMQDGGMDRPIEPEADLERALVNEELARLHMRRGTLTLAPPYLNDAEALYEHIPPPDGPAGGGRIQDLRGELTRLQLGGDDPDDAPNATA
jgi:hypothetical protein